MNLTAPKTSAIIPPPARAADGETVVAAAGLTKVFKDFWGRPKARAVDQVDFTVRRGEVFGLLGPNGSGKTTTLKLLLGLLQPTAGRIEVLGQSPHHVRTKERLGYLPEESLLYRFLTAAETLHYYGRVFRLSPEVCRERTEQLLAMTGLQHTGRRTVGEFSKGMQRRLGLAQALINDPDLVILDEPTAGLDPLGCREVKDLIVALARRGKTVILSSHLLADVEDVCDRVVVYFGGRIQALGPLRELLATPDRLQIITPAVPRADLEDALAALRRHAPPEDVEVTAPTQTLEHFFLGVVERARTAQATTSGATAGNRVADFLRAPADTPAPAKVLDRLTQVVTPEETTPAPNLSSETLTPTLDPTADRLEKLVAAAQTLPPAPARPVTAPAPPAAAKEINRKLAGLVVPSDSAKGDRA